ANAEREPLPDSCPRPLKAIVHKLLNREVDRRYASATVIREDLEAYLLGRTPRALAEFDTPPTIVILPGGVVSGRPPVAPTLPLDTPAPRRPPPPPMAPPR